MSRKSMTISLRDAPGTFLLRMNAAVTNSLLLYEFSCRSYGDSLPDSIYFHAWTEGECNDDAVSAGQGLTLLHPSRLRTTSDITYALAQTVYHMAVYLVDVQPRFLWLHAGLPSDHASRQ